MAKWGEGDPRWIVEERADATNVNNWHWYVTRACRQQRVNHKFFRPLCLNSCMECLLIDEILF